MILTKRMSSQLGRLKDEVHLVLGYVGLTLSLLKVGGNREGKACLGLHVRNINPKIKT